MNKESLLKARELISDALNKCEEITLQDKVELMLNLILLLDPEHYDEDIKILQMYSPVNKKGR